MNLFDLYATLELDSDKYEKGLDRAKGSANSVGSVIGSAFKVATAAVAAASGAMVAFGKGAVAVGMQFDSSMAQVAATMGVTVDEIDNLREFAQEMGRTTAFSATEAANALNYMALAGYDAETSMRTLPTVLNLAAAGGIDLAYASDMITDSQSALGLTMDETVSLVDQMAKAASRSNTSVSQLGEAILTIGGTAQFMTGGTTELATVLGILADNGIKGSEAGTHLRNMLLKLSSPTEDGAAALQQLGVAVFDSSGKMRAMEDVFGDLSASLGDLTDEQQVKMLSDIFNVRDVASAQALIKTTSKRWQELSEAIENAHSSAEDMAGTQLDNLAGDVTLFKSALEGAKIAVSDELTPSLRNLVKFGSTAISNLTSAFKEGGLSGAMGELGNILSDGVSKAFSALPSLTSAAGELIKAFVKGITDNLGTLLRAGVDIVKSLGNGIVKGLPTFFNTVKKLIFEFRRTFNANAKEFIGIAKDIIRGIADGLLKNAPVLVDTVRDVVESLLKDGGFGDFIQEMAPKVVEIIGVIAQVIAENAPLILSSIVDVLTGLALALTDPSNIQVFLDSVLIVLQSLAGALLENLPVIIDVFPQLISNILTAIEENFPLFVDSAIQILLQLVKGFTEALPLILDYVPIIVSSIIGVLTEMIPDMVEAGVQLLSALIDNMDVIIDTIVRVLPSIIYAIIDTLNDNLPTIIEGGVMLLTALIKNIDTIIETIVAVLPDIIDAIVNALIEHLGDIIQAGVDLLTALIDNLPLIINTIVNALPKIIDGIVLALIGAIPDLVNAGVTLFTSLTTNIPQIVANIISKLPEIIGGMINGILGFIPNMIETGKNLLGGLAEGIKNATGGVLNCIKSVGSGIVNGFKRLFGIRSPSRVFAGIGEMLDRGLVKGIEDYAGLAMDAAERLADGVTDAASPEVDFTVGSSLDAYGSIAGRRNNIVINVQGAEGQDVNELAEVISQKMAYAYNQEQVVWA